jgi:hypothetical protein
MTSPASARLPIELQVDELGLSVAFELPGEQAWAIQRPAVAESTNRDGSLTPRATATSPDGRLRLHLSASELSPPSLAAAAVYWMAQHRLEGLPDEDPAWDDMPAMSGIFESLKTPSHPTAAVWISTDGLCIELRLTASNDERAHLIAAWPTIRQTFRCAVKRAAAPEIDARMPWWSRTARLRERGEIQRALELVEREGDIAEALLVQAELHMERMQRAVEARDGSRARCVAARS